MAQEKLEDLSVETLKKRKKFVVFLTGIMVGLIVFYLVLIGISIVKDKKIDFSNYVPGFALILFIIIFYNGLKKINIELKRRDTTK